MATLKQFVEAFPNISDSASSLSPAPGPSQPLSKKCRIALLQDSDDEDNDIDHNEVNKYLSTKISLDEEPDEKFDILEFWRGMKSLPRLQKVARWVLGIPASEASDERVFSATGQTIGPRRTELAGSTLSHLTFIHKNY